MYASAHQLLSIMCREIEVYEGYYVSGIRSILDWYLGSP